MVPPPQLWPKISLGIILACGSISLVAETIQPGRDNPPQENAPRGATRLLQILISESAHLVWVLRCERIFQDHLHSTDEIRRRWLSAINTRLTDDKIAYCILLKWWSFISGRAARPLTCQFSIRATYPLRYRSPVHHGVSM